MIRKTRILAVRSETLRHLTDLDLGRVAGGHPTSWPWCLAAAGTSTQTIKCPTVACA